MQTRIFDRMEIHLNRRYILNQYSFIRLFAVTLYTRTEQAKDGRNLERCSVAIMGLGKETCPASVYIVMVDELWFKFEQE
jgi:hypothetical protein